MFEDLLKLVNDNAQDAVITNPEIPNEQNAPVTEHVTNGILDGLKKHAAGGGLEDVVKLLGNSGGDLDSNPVISTIKTDLTSSLMQKFGLSQGSAGNIISSMLPGIISQFVSQTNDPNNSTFSFTNIFNQLTGGKSSGFNIDGLVKSVTGGSGNGEFDLSTLRHLFDGGIKNDDTTDITTDSKTENGGLPDSIISLFGK